jgi:hypothetical protein
MQFWEKIMVKAFLSYSSKDELFVREFDKTLRAFGINTFLYERDIGIGGDIPQAIYKSIESATHFLYFISRSSVKSKWVQEELSIAKMREKENRGIIILPILIETIEKLPTSIVNKRYANFTDKSIHLTSANFQLILKELGIKSTELINEAFNLLEKSAIRNSMHGLLLVSADLQVVLSDISFLLRFATEHPDDTISIRRLMHTKGEIEYRQIPSRLKSFLYGLDELISMTLIEPLIKDIKKTSNKFLTKIKEIFAYQPTERPKTEWLLECAEISRYLQRRIGQLHYQLLLLYIEGKHNINK